MKVSHRGAISLTGISATTRIRVPSLVPGIKLLGLAPPTTRRRGFIATGD